jgi:hypothetical protein
VKKYLILISIIAVALYANTGFAWMNVINVGGGVAASGGGVVDNCPDATYSAAWTSDNTNGSTYICYSNGTSSEVATANTADGTTDYVAFDAADKSLVFTVSGGDIPADIDSAGTLFFNFRLVDDGGYGTNSLIELTYDNQELIMCRTDDTNARVLCYHYGGATSPNVNAGTGFSMDQDYRCGYTWCDGASGCNGDTDAHAIKCVTSGSVDLSSPTDEDEEALAGFDDSGAVDAIYFALGEYLSGQVVVDSVRVWDAYLVPGYKASDPGSL